MRELKFIVILKLHSILLAIIRSDDKIVFSSSNEEGELSCIVENILRRRYNFFIVSMPV